MRKVICALVAIRGSNSRNMSVYSSLCSFAFLTLAFAWLAAGKDCKTLDGKWYNQLGDEIYLKHGSDGRLLGEYRTKYAGEPHSAVLGYAPYDYPEATFAFSVVWRNGSSTRVWTGQCFICADHGCSAPRNGKSVAGCGENKTETIESTWLLRKQIDKCGDNWKSTLYGENTFSHIDTIQGPRKKDNTHTPDRSGEEDKKPNVCKGCKLMASFTLLSFSVIISLVKW